jgi:hypothetical protein
MGIRLTGGCADGGGGGRKVRTKSCSDDAGGREQAFMPPPGPVCLPGMDDRIDSATRGTLATRVIAPGLQPFLDVRRTPGRMQMVWTSSLPLLRGRNSSPSSTFTSWKAHRRATRDDEPNCPTLRSDAETRRREMQMQMRSVLGPTRTSTSGVRARAHRSSEPVGPVKTRRRPMVARRRGVRVLSRRFLACSRTARLLCLV